MKKAEKAEKRDSKWMSALKKASNALMGTGMGAAGALGFAAFGGLMAVAGALMVGSAIIGLGAIGMGAMIGGSWGLGLASGLAGGLTAVLGGAIGFASGLAMALPLNMVSFGIAEDLIGMAKDARNESWSAAEKAKTRFAKMSSGEKIATAEPLPEEPRPQPANDFFAMPSAPAFNSAVAAQLAQQHRYPRPDVCSLKL